MGNLHHDPVSDESLALMKGWIDACRHRHQLCMTPQPVHGPKRLLQCLPGSSVRLVEMRSPTQRCGYIALSYCWGDGNDVMKTTEETVTVVENERHVVSMFNTCYEEVRITDERVLSCESTLTPRLSHPLTQHQR